MDSNARFWRLGFIRYPRFWNQCFFATPFFANCRLKSWIVFEIGMISDNDLKFSIHAFDFIKDKLECTLYRITVIILERF